MKKTILIGLFLTLLFACHKDKLLYLDHITAGDTEGAGIVFYITLLIQ